MCFPCCWPFTDVWLEDPPKKKKEEVKKEARKEDLQYFVVEDDAVLYPTYAPAPVMYQPATQYYYAAAAPAPAPAPAPSSPKPAKHVYWYGSTKEEVDAQNAAIYEAHKPKKAPQLVPYKPANDQQYYCREFDNSYSLRTAKNIMESCQPGKWETSEDGYPYFVRHKKD